MPIPHSRRVAGAMKGPGSVWHSAKRAGCGCSASAAVGPVCPGGAGAGRGGMAFVSEVIAVIGDCCEVIAVR